MDYDLLVNPCSRENPLTVARRIVAEHEQDFADVETLLTAAQWRLLKFAGAGRYYLWALSTPDPLNQLMAELSYDLRDAAGIPPEWLGDCEPEEIFAGLRQSVAELTPDQCRAVWTVLSVAQARQLQVHQIVNEQWWRVRGRVKKLTTNEIGAAARKMLDATSLEEAERLRIDLLNGWYGEVIE